MLESTLYRSLKTGYRQAMRRSLLAMALALSSAACGDPTPTAPSGPLTITGRVIDFTTGAPLANVGLQFGAQRLVTDEQGLYRVTVVQGNYTLRVDAEPIAATVLVRGPWTRGDFFARGAGCGSRYGNVTDAASGTPIVGASIGRASSAPDGWYRLDGGCGSCGACNTTVFTVSA